MAFRQSSEDEIRLENSSRYLIIQVCGQGTQVCLSLESKDLSFDPSFCGR